MAVAEGVTYFPDEGERKILEAVFKNVDLAPFEIGLFWSISNASTVDPDAVEFTHLSLVSNATNPGALPISIPTTDWTVSATGTGTATAKNGTAFSFTNTGNVAWQDSPAGFYVATGTGASRKLILYQATAPMAMSPSSIFQVTLNVTLS